MLKNVKEFFSKSDEVFASLIIVTLLVCVPPFALYGAARLTGSLPSEAVWTSRGGNHGPWWDLPQGVIVTLSLLGMTALPFVTLLFSLMIALNTNSHRLMSLIKGLALAALQFFLAYRLLLIFRVAD